MLLEYFILSWKLEKLQFAFIILYQYICNTQDDILNKWFKGFIPPFSFNYLNWIIAWIATEDSYFLPFILDVSWVIVCWIVYQQC